MGVQTIKRLLLTQDNAEKHSNTVTHTQPQEDLTPQFQCSIDARVYTP
jgi:hypothetical protein